MSVEIRFLVKAFITVWAYMWDFFLIMDVPIVLIQMFFVLESIITYHAFNIFFDLTFEMFRSDEPSVFSLLNGMLKLVKREVILSTSVDLIQHLKINPFEHFMPQNITYFPE